MAKIEMKGKGNVKAVSEELTRTILNSGVSCELVDRSYNKYQDVEVDIRVFEKFYYRSSNRASLTIVVSGNDQNTTVTAIGAGGGQGPLFKLSWGTEEDFVSVVREPLRSLGFK